MTAEAKAFIAIILVNITLYQESIYIIQVNITLYQESNYIIQ